MTIVVPIKDGRLFSDSSFFIKLELGEGMEILSQDTVENLEETLFDYLIIGSKEHPKVDEAMELGARALLGRDGMRLEEIIEGLMFRELDEIV